MARGKPMLAIDLEGASPIYQQIADQLRGAIARGALEEGEALPSVRELGGEIGVNLNTVARAYRILADEGLLELRHGASARVRASDPDQSAPVVDETDRKRLDDLISRWVLRGADRKAIKRTLDDALERYFQGVKP